MLSSPRRWLLDFVRVFERVGPFLDQNGFLVAVVGALGLHAYGHDRATFDLDLLTRFAAQPLLVPFLEGLGYETLHVSPGFSNHAHSEPDWGAIDVLYVDDETARLLFSNSSRSLRLGEREVRVPSAEHLVAMKVQAMTNDPSRQLQDLADVQFLLGLPGIDRAGARTYFEKAGMIDWYDKLIERL